MNATTKLSLDSIRRAESISKVDKAQLVKSYVSSQKEFSRLYASEGQQTQEAWNLSISRTLEAVAVDAIDAGFRTPVLKARLPSLQSGSILEPPTKSRLLDSSVVLHVDKREDEKPKIRKSDKPLTEDARKGPPGTIRSAPRRLQRTLEECIPTSKGLEVDLVKTRKRRARSSDSEREARLSERRERRRAKRAIIEPEKQLPGDASDEENRDVTKSKGKGKKSKDKGKNMNVAAGLALMHGFSAKNVGPSRLTFKPSFGVFHKGKASVNTKTQTKRKQKPTHWAENTFLNHAVPSETNCCSKSSKSNATEDTTNTSTPTKEKTKFLPSKAQKVIQPHACPTSSGCPGNTEAQPSLARKSDRAESIVWDIELEDDVVPPSSKVPASSEQKNSTVVLDTRTVQWNTGNVAGSDQKSVPNLESDPCDMGVKMQRPPTSPRPSTPVLARYDIEGGRSSRSPSLAPSQSASQVIRSSTSDASSVSQRVPLLHHSKYFPSPRIKYATSKILPQPEPASTSAGEAHVVDVFSRDVGSVISNEQRYELEEQPTPDSLSYVGHGHSVIDVTWAHDPLVVDTHTEVHYFDYQETSMVEDLGIEQYDHVTPGFETLSIYEDSACSVDGTDVGSQPGYIPSADLAMHFTTGIEFDPSFYEDDSALEQAVMDNWEDTFIRNPEPEQDLTYPVGSSIINDGPASPLFAQEDEENLDLDLDLDLSTASNFHAYSQGHSLLHHDVGEWYKTSRSGSDLCQDKYPTVSKVEEDVAKQLRGHWRPQKL